MITLSLDTKKRFKAVTRGHEITIDVPLEKGGDDQGMMPTELYTTALSTCVGITLAGWLEKNQLPTEGLTVSANNKMSLSPRKIEAVSLEISLKQSLTPEQKKELQEILTSCPVMLSLKHPPAVEIGFKTT
jgi:putative redox protein